MNKILPWFFSLISLAVAAGVFIHYSAVNAAKDGEIKALNEKYASLVSESDSKLKDAETQISNANKKVQQIAVEAKQVISEITTEANDKLQSANLPEATVSVGFRKALFGNGNVAIIKNTSGKSEAITVNSVRPSLNQSNSFDLVIDSSRSKEIGEKEGWAFIQGDLIEVSQVGHKTMKFRMQ